ncbi:hypothetical protein NDU88_001761 [Pleurodeles waltl]|uniref:Uncharacterized protein n=1 Tax=Pleurodeles waltl TaxID=8319 RepID=A0AAV7Q421_PLEWA|nr:hypothetical protein NDU88_001761 [Pleurodeles waltl]
MAGGKGTISRPSRASLVFIRPQGAAGRCSPPSLRLRQVRALLDLSTRTHRRGAPQPVLSASSPVYAMATCSDSWSADHRRSRPGRPPGRHPSPLRLRRPRYLPVGSGHQGPATGVPEVSHLLPPTSFFGSDRAGGESWPELQDYLGLPGELWELSYSASAMFDAWPKGRYTFEAAYTRAESRKGKCTYCQFLMY